MPKYEKYYENIAILFKKNNSNKYNKRKSVRT